MGQVRPQHGAKLWHGAHQANLEARLCFEREVKTRAPHFYERIRYCTDRSFGDHKIIRPLQRRTSQKDTDFQAQILLRAACKSSKLS